MAFLLGSTLHFSANAAWTDVSTTSGLMLDFDIFPVAANNTRISATTTLGPGAGVWRSNDAGATWTQQLSGSTYRGTAINPGNNQIVLAGREGGQVERTSSGGAAWAATNSGTHGAWFFGFGNSTTVYAGGSTSLPSLSGIFLTSTDAGATWSSSAIDIAATPVIVSIATHPTNANIVYVGAQSILGGFSDGLYRSVDGGTTFTHLSNLPLTLVNAVTVDPNDGNLVYAGTANSGAIYRSTDGGDNWSVVHDQISDVAGFSGVSSIAVDPDDSRIIYGAGGVGAEPVIVSTDCGSTWTPADPLNQLPAGFAPARAEIDDLNDVVYVLVGNGALFRETQAAGASGSCPAGTSPGNPPVAVDDSINATEDTPFIAVTDLDNNDTDPDFDPLTVLPGTFATAQGGSITIAANGFYTYTPAANFNGNDSVNYTVTDGGLSDVGTLNIMVAAVDDPPVAVDDSINVPSDALFVSTVDLDANDMEVDGEALTVTAGTFMTAQGGSITIAGDGSYTYTPAPGFAGADSVGYTVTDGTTPDTGTLNITVTLVGDVGAGGGGGGNAGGDSAGGSGSGGSSIDYFLVILGFLLLGWQILGRNSGFGRSGA